MFKLTVEGDTFDELRDALASALGALDGAAPAKPAKAKPKPAADEDEAPPPKAKPKPKPAEDEGDNGASFYDTKIRPLILALSKTHREELLEIFGEFENAADDDAPCTKGSQVSEDDQPALHKKIKALKAKIDAGDD